MKTTSSVIEEIKIVKQVDMINEDYDPLIDVKGLPSWPSEPKYEEIIPEQAKLLQKHNIDLESFWTQWSTIYEETFLRPLPEITLKYDIDFDVIVFGIPVGSIPYVGSELLEVSPSLRDTVQHVGRIPSLQVQLYLDVTRENVMSEENIYWLEHDKSMFLLSGNDQNLINEDWKPSGADPKICQDISFMLNSKESHENCKRKYKNFIVAKFHDIFKNHWVYAYKNGHFNWDLLTDPENKTGVKRFDAQFWQCNINPSDLYTQILTNTSQYRITTDGAGFNNIYFTGDWIQNGFNLGSIEGAVTSGLLTSKAISGYPEKIFWENYITNNDID